MESLRRVRGIIGRGRAVFVSGPQYARPSAAASRQLFAAATSSAGVMPHTVLTWLPLSALQRSAADMIHIS